MTGLESNLRNILSQKETKIIPENIKKDVTIFGVTGILDEANPKIHNMPIINNSDIINNTNYDILDINTDINLVILKVSNTQIMICKVVNNNIVTDTNILLTTNDLTTIENKNSIMDAKFMYVNKSETELVGISLVVLTNYASWISKYAGIIQYINYNTLELDTKYDTIIEIPTDDRTPHGILMPRPLNSDCFAYYGYIGTNGNQHCLIAYYINDNALVSNTIFTTNFENHGTNRYGCWVPDGKLLYITDMNGAYYTYSVSDDNVTWTQLYTNIIPLNSHLGIKNNNVLYDLDNNVELGNVDFTLNYINNNWITDDLFLYIFDSDNLYVYDINNDFYLSNTYNITINKMYRNNVVYFVKSNNSINYVLYSEKNINSININNTNFYDTSDSTANSNDIINGKTAYINGGRITGTLENLDTSDATATAGDITINKTAYINGQKVTGNLPLFPNSRTFTVDGGVTNDVENNRIQISTINSTKQTLDTNLNMEFNGSYSNVAEAIGLTADKIKSGETIIGIDGTYAGNADTYFDTSPIKTNLKITYLITTIPEINTSNVTSMTQMFDGCINLTTVPLLDTSNVNDMGSMFFNCASLVSIPLFDTSSVTGMISMFYNCTELTTVPLLNTSNVINMGNMFRYCNNLSNESLNNILQMCINAVNVSSNKTLQYIGLSETQATTCTTLSNYQMFLDAGWTTGY